VLDKSFGVGMEKSLCWRNSGALKQVFSGGLRKLVKPISDETVEFLKQEISS